MDSMTFGQLVKFLRRNKRITLREFCRINGFNPGNFSRLENNKYAPKDEKVIIRIAKGLGLEEDSRAWKHFIATGLANVGRIPSFVMSDEELLGKLPLFFCKIDESV